jgi:hypothetical protein
MTTTTTNNNFNQELIMHAIHTTSTDTRYLTQVANVARNRIKDHIHGLIYYKSLIIWILCIIYLSALMFSIESLYSNSKFLNKLNNHEFDYFINYGRVVDCRKNMTSNRNCANIIKYCAVDSYNFMVISVLNVVIQVLNIAYLLSILGMLIIIHMYLYSIFLHIDDRENKIMNIHFTDNFFKSFHFLLIIMHIIFGLCKIIYSDKSYPSSNICDSTMSFVLISNGYFVRDIMIQLLATFMTAHSPLNDINYIIHNATLYHKPDNDVRVDNDLFISPFYSISIKVFNPYCCK